MRLQGLGRGWQPSEASRGARGWLVGLESCEAPRFERRKAVGWQVSELGEAMRGLFMACDRREDGELDEEEFAQS